MAPRIRIGPAEIIALQDGEGPFFDERSAVFPAASDEQWEAADHFDPTAVTDDGRWWLRFRAFAIRTDSGVTLVDAGIGPADSLAAPWAPVPGRLPEELTEAGIDPAEVDTVVITHLHTDHVGWAVTSTPDGRRPYFENARHLLQREESETIGKRNPQMRETLLDPLREGGLLDLVDGEAALGPVSRAVPTPGHTPGHQSVLVESGRDLVAVTGDVLVNAVQLLYPELAYTIESDARAARLSRQALLSKVASADGRLATPHLSEPFTSIPRESAERLL